MNISFSIILHQDKAWCAHWYDTYCFDYDMSSKDGAIEIWPLQGTTYEELVTALYENGISYSIDE